VFVGSGIFNSGDPAKRARAIVQAVTHFNNPKMLAEVSEDLGPAMVGLTMCVPRALSPRMYSPPAGRSDDVKGGRLAARGW
jgi:pyridoxal 5'-phosphate synthase pdxS subunit